MNFHNYFLGNIFPGASLLLSTSNVCEHHPRTVSYPEKYSTPQERLSAEIPLLNLPM
ncbi:MAG: hypothetical protein LBB16_02480 [Puniceicoccales bacterium]|nr:hypothetical protein [Puniceicoccales bacterium]